MCKDPLWQGREGFLEMNKANFAELPGNPHPSSSLNKFIWFPAPTWEWSWGNSGEVRTTLWGLKIIIYMSWKLFQIHLHGGNYLLRFWLPLKLCDIYQIYRQQVICISGSNYSWLILYMKNWLILKILQYRIYVLYFPAWPVTKEPWTLKADKGDIVEVYACMLFSVLPINYYWMSLSFHFPQKSVLRMLIHYS